MIRMIHPVLCPIILKNMMIEQFRYRLLFVWLDFPLYHPVHHLRLPLVLPPYDEGEGNRSAERHGRAFDVTAHDEQKN